MDLAFPKISPLGEGAVVVEFGGIISIELNQQAAGLATYLADEPFSGFVEAVPAYASTTVFFDPLMARADDSRTAYDIVAELIADVVVRIRTGESTTADAIEIPAMFDETSGPDLAFVSDKSGFSIDEVVELFMSSVYRVFMIGFLPGFAYMGEVDERIALPRKKQPRQTVPKGSIGIAGRQTGIYPLESPGGWQLIGRTDVELFTPDADRPTLFAPGDLVRFVPA